VGVGLVAPGEAVASWGTSGTVLTPTASPVVDPGMRAHTFCHAVPDTWYLMGVMLSAGGSFAWYQRELARDIARRRNAGLLLNQEAQAIAPGAEPKNAAGSLRHRLNFAGYFLIAVEVFEATVHIAGYASVIARADPNPPRRIRQQRGNKQRWYCGPRIDVLQAIILERIKSLSMRSEPESASVILRDGPHADLRETQVFK